MDPPRPVESEEGGAGMDPPARGGRREEGAPPLALGGGGRRGRCRRPMEEAGGTREEGATVVLSSLVSWRSRVDVEREGSAAANDEIPSCGSGRERTAKKIEPVGDMLHGGTHGQFFRVCIRVLLERCFFLRVARGGSGCGNCSFCVFASATCWKQPKPPLPPTIADGGTLALPHHLAHFHLHH